MNFQVNIAGNQRFHVTAFEQSQGWLKQVFNAVIVLEYHLEDCACSYCFDTVSKVGFKSPQNKAPNSWRILHLKSTGGVWYLRFTLPPWLCRKTTLEEQVAMRLRGEEIILWK